MTTLRRAVPGDAAELARLRGLMFEAMREPADAQTLRQSEQAFARRLLENEFAAYVVEGSPAGHLVSCGAGWVEEHLPSPRSPDGRRGHIASMSTEPAARRRGHGRAVFGALMGWLEGRGVSRVDLRATPDGEPLYASFGFRPAAGTSITMTWAR